LEETNITSNEPMMIFTPIPFLLIIFVFFAIISWKYRAILDFLFISFSTLAGFVVGLLRFESTSIGYAMTCAIAGFVISLAIDMGMRLYFKLESDRYQG
jgi:hypothetical protein